MTTSETSTPFALPISTAEKDRLVAENRALRDRDLLNARLMFESMPRVVDLQLSNVCNMSCTMCYDGHNPPRQELPEALVETVAAKLLPTASILTPFAGSEPLIVTWDLTRRLAERYGVELDIITNGQFLDEKKFAELEPHVSSLTISIDSHLPDVYEQIRLRAKTARVFENLPRAARLCREHGIEPEINVVVMVENAPFLDQTVAYFADQGFRTIRLLEFHMAPNLSRDRVFSDPLRYMSAEWLEWMFDKARRVAEQKQVRLMFEGHKPETLDYRPDTSGYREGRKRQHSIWDELKWFYPGYCPQVAERIKVHADGRAYPCCVAEGDDLCLGNLNQQSVDEVWNGPEAQDLRRAMLTHDLPGKCRDCEFHVAWFPDAVDHLPFVDWYHQEHCAGALPAVPRERRTLEVTAPAHLERAEGPPTFRWRVPAEKVDAFELVLGVGGIFAAGNRVFRIPGDATEFRIPDADWEQLAPHVAHWWVLYARRDPDPEATLRSPLAQCLVRQVHLPRVAGSTLYR
ncbi:MAG: radical SAM protein [Planctomycetota bacterium]